MQRHRVHERTVKILDEATKSQAETVARTLEFLGYSGRFLIKDSDNRFRVKIAALNENVVCVDSLNNFDSINPRNKSYIQADHNDVVTNIREKAVISDLFSVGGYGFAESAQFLQYYARLSADATDWNRELYVSDVIRATILDGVPFRSHRVTEYADWGTIHEWRRALLGKRTFFVSLDGGSRGASVSLPFLSSAVDRVAIKSTIAPRMESLLETLKALLQENGGGVSYEDNIDSGRTILARHVVGDEQINSQFSSNLGETLGATPAFREMLANLASARARMMHSLAGRQSPLLKYLGSKKPYQAMHAFGNESRRYLGGRLRFSRRPRVAICISGQLRGYRKAFATWNRKVLPHIDSDVFVHAWQQVGYSGAEPFRHVLPFHGDGFTAAYREQCMRLSHEAVKLRYPTLFGTFSKSRAVGASELRAFYGTDFVMLEDDRDPRFDGWSNSEKMHYKIQACPDLMFAQGRQYDLVIRVRPDLPISFLGFGWRELIRRCQSEALIMADAAMGVHYGHVMMGDQCAIGAPHTMRVYSGTYAIYPQLVPHRLFKFPPRLIGHVSIAYVCWLHGIRVERVPIKWQPLLDPKALSSATILEAVSKDATGRDDQWDRSMITAIKLDLQPSRGGGPPN